MIKNYLRILTVPLLLLACAMPFQQAFAAKTQQFQLDSSGYINTGSNTDVASQDAPPTSTQELPDVYSRAKVVKILETGTTQLDGQPQEYQKLQLEILNGDEKGKQISINNGLDYVVGTFQKYKEGETVVVAKSPNSPGANKDFYYITDRYRANDLIFVTLIFFALAIYFGRKRGFTSIIGMLFSVLVIFYFIIPHITKGSDPLWTCIAGAVAIILLSLYLSHGFNRRTTIALVSTLLALGLAIIIDVAFVHIAKLAGNGTEEAFYLQFDSFNINLQGLLLGGIIIGVLGVLDDVTTGQAAAIEEIYDANNSLTFADLYRKGLSVGREHIASLINTLVLAYVGASFPLLLLYSTQKLQPLWVTMNSNFIAEEIVRTLVGSSVLVIAVPLTTLLAALWFSRQHRKPTERIQDCEENKRLVLTKDETIAQLWRKK